MPTSRLGIRGASDAGMSTQPQTSAGPMDDLADEGEDEWAEFSSAPVRYMRGIKFMQLCSHVQPKAIPHMLDSLMRSILDTKHVTGRHTCRR